MSNSFTKVSGKNEVQEMNVNLSDKQVDRDQLQEFSNTIDAMIKGKNNMLTEEEDLHSQVIVAAEFICRGLP